METKIVEYWIVQSTGYSAGVSWFDARIPGREPVRFDSESAARAAYAAMHWGGKEVKWRLVRVQVASTPDQRVTTERFIKLRAPRGARLAG